MRDIQRLHLPTKLLYQSETYSISHYDIVVYSGLDEMK